MDSIVSTAYLMGGLGNQLFQIAHAISQGLKNNIPTIFKPISYTPTQGLQPEIYLNNIYRNISFSDVLPQVKRVNGTFNFTDTTHKWDSSIEFFGYYQSSKYFYGYDELLKIMFEPTKYFLTKVDDLYPNFFNTNNLSLHIRRGDYLKISDILPVIDKSYIDESIKQIGDYDKLFVFSEDKEWVIKNIKYDNMVIVDKFKYDYEELWMMSLCENNIMSNSSFSWWASFLNKNRNKKVLAPSIWFGPKSVYDERDIYESYHRKIKVQYEDGKLKYEG